MSEDGAQEHHYPCESCGADLRFAPGQTVLVCDHCGHEQHVAVTAEASAVAATELDYAKAVAQALPASTMEEVRTVTCPNCGASFGFDAATHAAECPFCAAPVVTDTGSARQFKPQAVVPFALTEVQARAAMTQWLGRLWFAPSGLVDYARKGRAMQGMYVPYWTYDADTASRYSGQRGVYYYETRIVTVNVNGQNEQREEQVRRTQWYPAAGQVARRFDDVLVMASTSLPRHYVDGLEPWDLTALAAYSPDYLAGFRAEAYTVGLEDGHAIARKEMDQVILQDVRNDIGGDEQRVDQVDTQVSDETFKHILLPIWMAAYKYRDRSYRFVVNAQTGKVQGERPWSAWKIAGAIVLAAIVVGVAVYLKQTQGH